MNIKYLLKLSIILLFLTFVSCSDNEVTNVQGTVNFSRDIHPILIKNCAASGCHNSIDNQAGFDVTSWNSLVKEGSSFGTEIVPFNSFWSHMVWHINRDTNNTLISEPLMPPANPPYTNGRPLTDEQLKLIMRWIDEGAKNDYGEAAWSNIPNKAFITNQAADLIAIVNLDNFRLIRLISTGSRDSRFYPPDAPHYVNVDKQNRYFYVSLVSEGFIEKFDALTYQKVGRFNTGPYPAHIDISNDGNTGYISNFSTTEYFIKKFDTSTLTVLDTFSAVTLKSPHGLRLTSDNNYVIAASQLGEHLFKIKTSDMTLESSTPVDETVPPSGSGTGNFLPYQVALSKDNRYAFVSLSKANIVRVFDLENYLMPAATIQTGQKPLSLEVSPDGKWLYIPNQASNSVTVIDAITFQTVKTIPDVGVQPHMVDFTSDGKYALVTCESLTGSFIHHALQGSKKPGTTAVINVAAGHIKIYDIEMASFPAGISITN